MKEPDYTKLGARIRRIRKEKGWSQDELAQKCGISMNFVGHIERGTRKMSLDTFVCLCRELDADADALLFGVMKNSEDVMRRMWSLSEKKDSDSYAMYIRIMKSVADIMSDGYGCE